ncbi:MAG: formate--tetrahydrofolate ligase [Deltaproteobacteria bacterium]|nr:formate--tetrahydrofolate ligase [Deltaproteobacteria bacterium]
MLSSLDIALAVRPKPIENIARALGILPEELELHGRFIAKVDLAMLSRLAGKAPGKLVLVTAITPTPLGEGKTTTTLGLVDGLNYVGVRAAATVRQPSLGPVFGIKGGANGGGYAQVVPMVEFNLHLTGDAHAVGAANNLAAAFLDNHLHHGNALKIDPLSVTWPRVLDISDRALREVVVGLGGKEGGIPRQEEFFITAASEVMAILAMAGGLEDLRARLGRVVLARRTDGSPVTADDLKVAGSMAVLLREAIKPNLMQTLEGNPVLVHAGPFGNIAQGTSSVLADRLALQLCEVVCTEAGFGADLGGEKFFDIKCRHSGLVPDAAVMVATIRALKMHGGVGRIVSGKPLDAALTREDVEAVRRGASNLAKQIENVRAFGIPVVVAINSFPTDTPAEVAAVREVAKAAGAREAVTSTHFAEGGRGAEALARAVRSMLEADEGRFQPLYPDEWPLARKIEAVATRMYGADGVDVLIKAARQLADFEKLGYGRLPVCIAKTHLSLSHEPELKGRPSGFRLPIREARLSAGAGFVTAVAGEMRLMPGLPSHPSGETMDVEGAGKVVGLH